MNLPIALTLFRIVLVPPIMVFLISSSRVSVLIAAVIFMAASFTDWLDGRMARRWNQVTKLGTLLDPVADKLLVAAAILMLVASDHIQGLTVLAAVVILCREILVAGLREFLAEVRVKVPVTQLAKWKTTLQMVAIGFLLAGDAAFAWLPALLIGEIGLWIAALLTLYTGYDYLRAGLRHMLAHPEDSGPGGGNQTSHANRPAASHR